MPADRTQRKSRAGPSTPRSFTTTDGDKPKQQSLQHRSGDGVPGVGKLKSSIRQTKRLLQKEGLEPGLRIQTQRRLESLEADLAKSERRNVEMKNGARYHMVKFFERQKIMRIIKKQRKLMEKTESTSAKVQEAEKRLEQARMMLNYVLNFPNTEKYISLMPPSSPNDPNPKPKLTLPSYLDEISSEPSKAQSSSADQTSRRRLDILREMKRLMDAGKLSKTPEVGLSAEAVGAEQGQGRVRVDLPVVGAKRARGVEEEEEEGEGEREKGPAGVKDEHDDEASVTRDAVNKDKKGEIDSKKSKKNKKDQKEKKDKRDKVVVQVDTIGEKLVSRAEKTTKTTKKQVEAKVDDDFFES